MSEPGKLVVAMSGGVDSSLTAALCKEQGYDVVGLFMRHGATAPAAETAQKQGCCSAEDAEDARRVAYTLDIPFYVVNFESEFGSIIDYFVSEYDRGRTPNPCVLCNRSLKFGKLLEYADAVGAVGVATGHYARTVPGPGGRTRLLRGVDPSKDQSYVLFPLSQTQLARARFPLGGMTKAQVRDEARQRRLPNAEKRDSQEICFVPGRDLAAVLQERLPDRIRDGDLVTTDGRRVGRHHGYQHYTVGQRHGLGVALGRPAYVVRVEAETNRVVVGTEEEIHSKDCTASRTNWVSTAEPPVGEQVRAVAKVRYQHSPAPCTVEVTAPAE
ncbi:MAG: tRNA 2-thiouridine(34) synthase MnmA [Planctomycetes bacterium]|nr:tRNA 2-thiouridine(34) synthase MnmA [Planctomycetota bacterium]